MCVFLYFVVNGLLLGIETEILYQLMTFGIPPSAVPWVGGGSQHHERWLEERQWIETHSMLMDMDLDDHNENSDDFDNQAECNDEDQ